MSNVTPDQIQIVQVPVLQWRAGQIINKHEIHWAKEENAFFNECISPLPFKFRKSIEREYKRARKSGLLNATVYVREVSEIAKKIRYYLAENDSELIEKADEYAGKCQHIYESQMKETGGDLETAFLYLVQFAGAVPKVPAPDSEKFGLYGACQRMLDAKQWRRWLRKKHARGLESLALKLNQVNDHNGIYCSEPTLRRRVGQRQRNARILENVTAVNEIGQEYTLLDLAALSVSNPAIRRMELMTRIDGFEQYAKLWGDAGEFYTVTCPSRMHAAHGRSRGRRNDKYDGTTPRQAQKYLTNQWAKIRAELGRMKIDVYGFRVVEPHQDGTPHWHLLLFMNPNDRFYVRLVMARYALEVDGNERGAIDYRFKAESIKTGINQKTGREYSAAGYIAKYISKAIDGYGVESDLYGTDAAKAAERIEAWASTWGIRQFQQIGGPSITVWRELRRLGDEEVNGSELLERARECANAGDWQGYCRLNWSGEISLLKKEVDEQGAVNKYGDEKQMNIYGVEAGGVGVVTRRHIWEVSGGEAATAKRTESAEPWTGVNNCTESQLETAVDLFNRNYSSIHHQRVKSAEKWGFSAKSAFENVKREAVAEILAEKFGFSAGPVIPDDGFMIVLRKKWHDEAPREVLLEEWEDSGGGDFGEFAEWHFSEFCRDYLWSKYGVKYE